MELNEKQKNGLALALQRYKNKEKYTVIAGYAGAGKSTLVRFIIEELKTYGVKETDVCFACFTGKAAQVLLKKGNKNVITLHKLLYKSIPKESGGFVRIPNPSIPYKIVVVDEVSMAPKTLMDLLFKHDVYVICLGDPFQLPPVDKKEDNHLLDAPHIFLDEIMRQAQESEIIQLSMAIRENRPIEVFQGKEVQILNKEELNTGMLTWADQILVATNATRVSINTQMRKLLNFGEKPQDGDKIICLRNYWDCFSDNEEPLVNGTIGILKDSFLTKRYLPRIVKSTDGLSHIDLIMGDFISDSGMYFHSLEMDKKMIDTGEFSLDWKTVYQLNRNPKTRDIPPLEFTYGYAITCHKAQGSEWDKVLVIEEKFPFDKTEHARWLYTAVTRSSEKLVLVR